MTRTRLKSFDILYRLLRHPARLQIIRAIPARPNPCRGREWHDRGTNARPRRNRIRLPGRRNLRRRCAVSLFSVNPENVTISHSRFARRGHACENIGRFSGTADRNHHVAWRRVIFDLLGKDIFIAQIVAQRRQRRWIVERQRAQFAVFGEINCEMTGDPGAAAIADKKDLFAGIMSGVSRLADAVASSNMSVSAPRSVTSTSRMARAKVSKYLFNRSCTCSVWPLLQ